MRTRATILLLLLAFPASSRASSSDVDRATLTELGSLLVDVRVSAGDKPTAVDADLIKNDVEATLRGAGLTVYGSVAEARAKNKSDVAILIPTINLVEVPNQPGQFVFGVALEVKQMATLVRDPSRRALAITWSVATAGEGPLSAIRSAVKDMADVFVNDYFAVNPRPAPAGGAGGS